MNQIKLKLKDEMIKLQKEMDIDIGKQNWNPGSIITEEQNGYC